jgi:hypothetical protein
MMNRRMEEEQLLYIPGLSTARSGATGITSSHPGSNSGERAGEDGTGYCGERTGDGLAKHCE